MTTKMKISEAAASLADDIESGKVVPGTGEYYRRADENCPSCALGHLAYRAQGPSPRGLVDPRSWGGSTPTDETETVIDAALAPFNLTWYSGIVEPNDNGDLKTVVENLRRISVYAMRTGK